MVPAARTAAREIRTAHLMAPAGQQPPPAPPAPHVAPHLAPHAATEPGYAGSAITQHLPLGVAVPQAEEQLQAAVATDRTAFPAGRRRAAVAAVRAQ
jgi:hypothetical protein